MTSGNSISKVYEADEQVMLVEGVIVIDVNEGTAFIETVIDVFSVYRTRELTSSET